MTDSQEPTVNFWTESQTRAILVNPRSTPKGTSSKKRRFLMSAEGFGPLFAAEHAGDLLLHLHHANVPFGQVMPTSGLCRLDKYIFDDDPMG